MRRAVLLHPNPTQAAPLGETLQAAGFAVEYYRKFETSILRACRLNPPDVFVIELSRLPSHGLEVGVALRQSPKTRAIPIVFCGGDAAKVKLIRRSLPDAAYCKEGGLADAVTAARPVLEPVRPAAMMNRYGTRTAAEKLGVKPGTTVTLIDAPARIEHLLGDVQFAEDEGSAVTLCFAHSADGMRAGLTRLRAIADRSKCWILWRKKSSPAHNGVTEPLVRETGIALGLVDYKICSVDSDWSAMLFAKKKG